MKSAREFVMSPESFVADLKATGSTPLDLSRICGVHIKVMRRILEGQPVPKGRLESATKLFYKSDEDSLFLQQMRIICLSRDRSETFARARLQNLVMFLQEYGKRFSLSRPTRKYYVFEPRSVIKDMAVMLDEIREMLKKVHRLCPECERVLYAKAPVLYSRTYGRSKRKIRRR